MALFLVAGCTGDARQAAEYALSCARALMCGDLFRTETNDGAATGYTQDAPASLLGLYRVEKGSLKGSPYRLDAGDEGTEIGSLSLAPNSINDVGRGVSRRHARIWRDDDENWYVQGLGSTNGSILVKKNPEGECVVIEPPRDDRPPDYIAQPVPIQSGDRLVLAGTTEFVVVVLPAQD